MIWEAGNWKTGCCDSILTYELQGSAAYWSQHQQQKYEQRLETQFWLQYKKTKTKQKTGQFKQMKGKNGSFQIQQ